MATPSHFACLFTFALLQVASANEQLRRIPSSAQEDMAETLKPLNDSAVDELFWLMKASEHRQPHMQALLRPMFDVLPSKTDSSGKVALLGPNSLRYALHRVFVARHGWQMRGLEPKTALPNRALDMDESKLPKWLKAFLDRRHGDGMDLGDVSALAAMLEENVHQDGVNQIQRFFDIYAKDGLVSEKAAAHVAVMSGSAYDDLKSLQIISKATVSIDLLVDFTHDRCPKWERLRFPVWLSDIFHSQKYAERSLMNPFKPAMFNFEFFARVLDVAHDKHGRWQNIECIAAKGFLVELDDEQLGRVPLTEFYKAQLENRAPPPFEFSEPVAYLQHLGAVDNTDARRPGLMVPNYILAHSNCISSGNSHHICCVDECETLLARIEAEVKGPTATPDEIAAIVTNLPSDTVVAPRPISEVLRERLNGIAMQSDGRVSLHGRLFAQWLHHVYPYECPYPHTPTSNDTGLITADAWLGSEMTSMSERDLHHAITKLSDRKAAADEEHVRNNFTRAEIAWSDHEVLFTSDEHNVIVAAHGRGRSKSTSSLPAVVVLLSAVSWFFCWATSAISAARRSVALGSATAEKWNKQVLFT